MKITRLQKILGMIIATSALGARGLSCGPCPDSIQTIPLLPPSSDGGAEDAGALYEEGCSRFCAGAASCDPTTIPLEDGGAMPAITCTQPGACGAGRRPEGLATPIFADSDDTPAGWLARATFLEAAAVDAFRLLRRDLRALGAPRRLQRAASRAARDERRHARQMRSFARRHGASVPVPAVHTGERPSLEALAVHNAAEGCVRETFGALLAQWQAGAAGDRALGATLSRIARDEARHAALAWAIDAWARRRLGRAAQARVDGAREEAARALVAGASLACPEALVTTLGLPDGPRAERLAAGLARALRLLG